MELTILRTPEDKFSYTCNACRRCCYDKRIVVNPYESARLARNRGLSTTDFLAQFTESGGTFLRVKPDGACIFLGGEGCTVHSDRPLVCRLYPLGRIAQADGSVSYVECEPHPETAGVYGTDGTIAAYVQSQGAAPYIEASDRYYTLLCRLALAFKSDAAESTEPGDLALAEDDRAFFIDVDSAVRSECERTGEEFPDDVHVKVDRHIQLVEEWLNKIEKSI